MTLTNVAPNAIIRDKKAKEISKLIGFSVQAIGKWVRKGCPCDESNPDFRLFNEIEVRQWLKDHPPTPGKKVSADQQELVKVRIKQILIRNDDALFDYGIKTKKYLLASEVEQGRLERIIAVKSGLANLITNLPPRLYGKDEMTIQTILETEIDKLLNTFAGEPK